MAWRQSCPAVSRGCSGTRTPSPGRWCSPRAAPHSLLPLRALHTTPGPTSGGTCKRNKKRKQRLFVLLGKVEFSMSRDCSKLTKSYHEWRFFVNPYSPGQATVQWLVHIYEQMQHLVEVFIFSKHFLGRLEDVEGKPQRKKINVKRRLLWKNQEL